MKEIGLINRNSKYYVILNTLVIEVDLIKYVLFSVCVSYIFGLRNAYYLSMFVCYPILVINTSK